MRAATGRRVRALRLARGLTQAQLAGPDFSKGYVSLVETGRSRMSLRSASVFARRLGVPISLVLAERRGSQHGLEASLRTAIERAAELERYARRTQEDLRTALTAVRAALDTVGPTL